MRRIVDCKMSLSPSETHGVFSPSKGREQVLSDVLSKHVIVIANVRLSAAKRFVQGLSLLLENVGRWG